MKPAALCLLACSALLAMPSHAEWKAQQHPGGDAGFRAVRAVNANVVWVGGSGGTCLRTLNGGDTWEKIAVPNAERLDFRSLAAFDDRTALLVSAGEASEGKTRIYRTEDGGLSWQVVFDTQEKGAFLDGVAFWDRKRGLIVGDPIGGKWYLLRTEDGGRNWSRVAPQSLPDSLPGEGAFAASNSALVVRGASQAWIASGVAERARVLRTNDRGKTWQVVDTPMPAGDMAGTFGLHFWDDLHGIGVGGEWKRKDEATDNVILTADGGKTWQTGPRIVPNGLKSAAVLVGRDTLLAVGPTGTGMSKDNGKTWQAVDNQSFNAASCFGQRCWAVGPKGAIARWE